MNSVGSRASSPTLQTSISRDRSNRVLPHSPRKRDRPGRRPPTKPLRIPGERSSWRSLITGNAGEPEPSTGRSLETGAGEVFSNGTQAGRLHHPFALISPISAPKAPIRPIYQDQFLSGVFCLVKRVNNDYLKKSDRQRTASVEDHELIDRDDPNANVSRAHAAFISIRCGSSRPTASATWPASVAPNSWP